MSRQKEKFIVLDVETANDIPDTFTYDVGFVVADRSGKIYHEHSFVISDIFTKEKELMQTCYYANKLPLYEQRIAEKSVKVVSIFTVRRLIKKYMDEYGIKKVYAYNAHFDRNALNTTQRYLTKSKYRYFFPYGTEICCIWHMACQTICNRMDYCWYCLKNGYYSTRGNMTINCGNVELYGLHCHIGSQIFDIAPFEEAAKVMLELIAKIKNELNYEIQGLNLGGGFGIKYLEEHDPQPFGVFMERVSQVVISECEKLGINRPFIYIEPGRSIAASAGITLYTVGTRKEIPDIRTYVSVDGGMADNPRYILYKSEYEAIVANKASEERSERVTIAGKCCESGDLIGENMPLQHAESGDIIAVCATGAYNFSMSSNYNRLCRPALVFVNKGESRIAVKRQTLDDIIRNDV